MKKALCILVVSTLVVSMCMGAFCLSALAVVNPDFAVPVASSAPSYDDMFSGFNDGTSDCRFWVNSTRLTGGSGQVVCCAYPGYLLFLSTAKPSGYWLYYNYGPGHSSGNTNLYNTITVDGVTYYTNQWTVSSGYTVLCEVFNDYNQALAACVAALDYSPPPEPVVNRFSIVLYPGYALEITSDLGFDATIEALQPVKNVLPTFYSEFGGYWWPGCPSGYSLSALPFDISVGTVLSSTSFSRIPWLRVNTDFLGQTKQSKWTTLFGSSNVLIYNPYIYIESSPLRGNYDAFNNTPITITLNSVSNNWDYKLYKLSDNVVTGVTSAYIESSVVEIYEKNPELMGGFVNSDGSPVVQKIGGGLASDNDQQLTLDSLVSDLDNFFRGSWEHIRYLVNAISDFPALVVQLYSWLPAEFRALMLSAFSITLVIGVLKVML